MVDHVVLCPLKVLYTLFRVSVGHIKGLLGLIRAPSIPRGKNTSDSLETESDAVMNGLSEITNKPTSTLSLVIFWALGTRVDFSQRLLNQRIERILSSWLGPDSFVFSLVGPRTESDLQILGRNKKGVS